MCIPDLSKRVCVPDMPEHMRVPDMPEHEHTPRSEEESAEIIIKGISALCQQLSAVSDRSTLDLKTLKAIKYSLKTAIALANGPQALPERDVFNPNRKTWAETAKRMGNGKALKRKHSPVSGGNMSTEHISPVKGKRSRKYIDPYARGERSGKCAKPDAVSVAANILARATVPALAAHTPAMVAPVHASACLPFLHFHEPVGGSPACISAFKRCAWACICFACCCCACPCARVPFHCSGGLRCAFIRSCEPVGGGPTCISIFKRRARSRVCAFFHRIAQAHVCASFLHRYRVWTCTDIHPDTFLGSSYARECPCVCAFAPWGLTYHSMLRDVP